MFVNDIFKKKLNETVLNPRDPQGDYDAKRKVLHDLSLDPQVDQQAVLQRRLDLDREAKAKGLKEQGIEEAGPFSYGAKKPKKGSVADLAAQKRKEQEKGKQPIEPRDQRVGVARVVKDVAEGAGEKLLGKMIPGGASVFNAADAVRRFRSGDTVGAGIAAAGTIPITAIPAAAADMARDKYYTGSFLPSDEQRDLANLNRQVADMEKKNWTKLPDGSERSPDGRTIRGTVTKLSAEPQSKPVPGSIKPDSSELLSKPYPDDASSVKEGSTQEKLYRRHQELRKKSGLPDPDYYKELKASYDLPDEERYAKQKEIKQKYKVTNEDREQYIEELGRAGYEIVNERRMTCPECGGVAYEDQMLAEKQDACYHKVKSRYKVWPSAYASGALVRCRKKGAKNWGNKSK